jgi:hypothetical protein
MRRVAFSCATIDAPGLVLSMLRTPKVRPAAPITALPPTSSGSSLVLTMKPIGRGARGLAVVGSSSELLHHGHPCTTPTHDLSGIGDDVTRRDRSRTTASVFSAIAAEPESTSSTPSLPTDAVMLAARARDQEDVAAHGQHAELAAAGRRLRAERHDAAGRGQPSAAAAAISTVRSVIRTPPPERASCRPATSRPGSTDFWNSGYIVAGPPVGPFAGSP